uniref:ATP-dependent Clp protease proteolytic subunit n=1 Tax=Chlamydomonas moewusii TaxID=3054 RepID=CLPP_CHLMO|nr:RecName: Full=ATP-dependent Clp protease proteolytic subunit; AltName: Full=Endopeptidase Clp; Contains: RecName: Full=Ceu clpP intein; AltName: Full=Insertion IS2 [Chlamydomonas moewusii]AAA84150.1 clpP subunit of Clp protease [Chlamydomonas moewusii]
MPIGVPRIIYCWGEELPAQWTDIYNFIFRRRMVFLMQYLDDELCNQICGLLINIHMEDRSKELEKKEIERSGLFKGGPKTQKGGTGAGETGASSIQNKKSNSSSFEDLLAADEDLGIDENNTLEQYTLQKITMEWLNWNAQFFDYSDEPYLFYLAEMLSKDFNKGDARMLFSNNNKFSMPFSQMLNTGSMSDPRRPQSTNGANWNSSEQNNSLDIYSPFRMLANFEAQDYDFKQINPSLASKEEVFKLFNNTILKNGGQRNNNMSKLLTELAQRNWENKTNSQENLYKSTEKALSQRNLRKEYIKDRTLNNYSSDPFNTKGYVNAQGASTGPSPRTRGMHADGSLNYLDFYSYNDSYNDFKTAPRGKQAERAFQEEESKKVFVIINSFGGSVGNGITVHDALQFIKAGSLTLALGVAASAASLALAGGTIGERYVTEGCHVMIHQPECLTSDHTVLTTRGWIPIADVTLDDKVAVLDNNTGEMSYQNPQKVHKYDYEGPMYEVKTAGVDLFVTPNHRMYVNTTNNTTNQNYNLVEASSIFGKKVRYKNDAIWNKTDYQFILPETATLTGHTNKISSTPAIQPEMNAWLTFFGLWIANGHTTKIAEKTAENNQQKQRYKVILTQVKEDVCDIIEQTLNKLGFNFIRSGKDYTIENKQLWSYLNPFDNGALNKYLPDWVWELSSQQCKILLNSLCLGNCLFTKNDDTLHYFSTSERFANDVSRLALHAGTTSTIQLEAAPSNLYDTIIGLPVEVNTTLWRVIINQSSFYSYSTDKSSALNLSNNVACYVNAQSALTLEQNSQKINKNTLVLTKNNVKSQTMHSQRAERVDTALLTQKELDNSLNHEILINKNPGTSQLECVVNPEVNNTSTNDRFVYYKGPVYCLTGPNNVFYVQRNGKAVWTGNSSIQGQASDIWIDSQEIMKIRLDVAEIYSLATYRPRHKILRDLDRDFYLTATETIHYGLADEIASNEVMQEIIEMTSKVWDYHDTKQQRLLESRDSTTSGADTQSQN